MHACVPVLEPSDPQWYPCGWLTKQGTRATWRTWYTMSLTLRHGRSASSLRCWWCWRSPNLVRTYASHTQTHAHRRKCVRMLTHTHTLNCPHCAYTHTYVNRHAVVELQPPPRFLNATRTTNSFPISPLCPPATRRGLASSRRANSRAPARVQSALNPLEILFRRSAAHVSHEHLVLVPRCHKGTPPLTFPKNFALRPQRRIFGAYLLLTLAKPF